MRRLALLATVLAALALAPDARAQVPTDSSATPAPPPADDPEANEPDAGDPGSINDGTAVETGRIRFRPRLAPSALYSSNHGFGIGGGVAVDNLTWRGSIGAFDVRAQQFYLGATASAFTGDPLGAPLYGGLTASASTTTRRLFFGAGPFTGGNESLFLPHRELDAEALVGAYPLGNTALRIQPSVRFLLDRTDRVREDGPGQLAGLSAASQAVVVPVLGETRTGLSVGVEVATDLRDWPSYPKRGTLVAVEARRFYGLDQQDLRFNRFSAQSATYIPLHGRTAVVVSFTGAVTRQADSDGDGQADPIPYYYLPTLDERAAFAYREDRLTGRDIAAVGLGLRVPIRDFIGVYAVDALVVGYLGNAYDDVFRQFSPRVSFRQDPLADADGRAALRPALGLGIGVVNLDKERVVLGALIGVGAGGVTLASLRAAYNLRDARPLFR